MQSSWPECYIPSLLKSTNKKRPQFKPLFTEIYQESNVWFINESFLWVESFQWINWSSLQNQSELCAHIYDYGLIQFLS